MLRIVTGPFHPHLEQALAEEVRQLKATDPLAPLALIVPSTLLLARLRDRLVLEEGLSLLNVHFLTFHQLALRLYEERRSTALPHETASTLEVVKDLFFEQLLCRIVERDLPALEPLRPLCRTPGTWSALWATVRDLKDATVDPAVALRGISEGLFDPEDAQKLQALFTLHGAVLEASRALGVGSPDDLTSLVIPWVSASRFLARLQRVCYYGFYDLTQVQLSLFEAVTACAPATLYFPLSDGPRFAFARRFFEGHLYSLVGSSEQGPRIVLPDASPADRLSERHYVRIISATGPEDELTLVCKEILMLVETHSYRFEAIGVVARTLEPYQASFRRTFDQHRIPFTSTAVSPVIQEPAIKVLLQLASLPLSGFYQKPVLDVLTSPFYRINLLGIPGIEARPDLWQLAVRSLGITRGEEEWQRLASAKQVDIWVGGQDEPEEEQEGRVGKVQIEAAQVRLLWRLVSQLIQECRALPLEGSVAELTDAFENLAARHLTMPGLSPERNESSDPLERLALLGTAIQDILQQLRQLDRFEGTITWEEWVRLFTRALDQSPIPVGSNNHRGVHVLDAMAARGLPFRALFLLGLNEKVFPRFIREDAFLRDRHRRVLDATLGYKIDEKLSGYEEEQLLFALLTQAARSRLYLLYQRADEDGRPLAVSTYMADVRRARSADGLEQEVRLPRRLSDRLGMPQFSPALLTRQELGLSLVLQGYDPSALLDATGQEAVVFRNGWNTLQMIEGETQRLGPYDGLLGPIDWYWEQLAARGLAPTPLEQYGRCPFQYFAAQVLRLQSLRQPVMEELPAQVLGELCHATLRACYQRLVEAGWPHQELASVTVQEQVTAATDEVFTAHALEHGTGHALTWQLARETVMALVTAALEADQQDYCESGFRPIGFEVEAEGRLEGLGLSGFESLKVRGRLDRIDQRVTPLGFRVVDYKYRQGREMKSQDRDLLTSAIRGFRLQPPLYALMTMPSGNEDCRGATQDQVLPEQVQFLFLAPRWERALDRSQFDASALRASAGRQLRQTLRTLLEGVRSGQFFILPDGYCDHCEFSTACRRFHGPTWWRAHNAAPAKQLRQLRKQKVSRE